MAPRAPPLRAKNIGYRCDALVALHGRLKRKDPLFQRDTAARNSLSLSCSITKEVEHGDIVTVHYIGRLESGKEFDNTRQRAPVEFEVGGGRVIDGVEEAVIGMKEGELNCFKIPCEKAFGPIKLDLIVNVSKSECPEDLVVGQRLGIKGLHVIVSNIYPDKMEIDGNLPLAGEDLLMEVEVLRILKSNDCRLATFAGGSFWPLELIFQRIPGVVSTQAGYTGGTKDNPTYPEVCSESTGHAEAVLVKYDPKRVSYLQLLETFFEHVDVTQLNRQGNDVGTQYRNGIYYHDLVQKKEAETALLYVQEQLDVQPFFDVERSNEFDIPVVQENCTVVTELLPAKKFWRAEEKHQQFLEKLGFCSEKGSKEPIVWEFEFEGARLSVRELLEEK
uniref:peptidylprolyl isomerase n=1 Tax=Hanusia phi TaxID=3032 RepID=A0A7S0E031_9CRYP